MKIILASGSPRRRELLTRYGIEYEIKVSDCDETVGNVTPEEAVKELSLRKARAVLDSLKSEFAMNSSIQQKTADGSLHGKEVGRYAEMDDIEEVADITGMKHVAERNDIVVLGADTVVANQNRILGKPATKEAAIHMLTQLQGHSHQVYTGVAILYNGQVVNFAEKTEVRVAAMTEQEIEEYVATGECMDKAGSYAIQGIFAKYIEGFDGDYNNVVGLPADRVLAELWKLGYHLPEKKVKLVVSDIDGTLVKDSSPAIYPEMLDTIRKLRKKGILFCIASGRQYASIRTMFREVADDIIFLCENGAHLVYRGENLYIKEMKREDVVGILQDLRQYSPEHKYVISAPEGSYLENPCKEFELLIRDSYHNKYELTEDFLALNRPSIKLAVYEKGSIRELGEKVLIPKWTDRVKTCMAGEEWVDFMDKSVDKGNAMEFLLNYLGVDRNNVMVFGDNGNDLGLLKSAEESYVVSNARPEIKQMAKYICPAYWYKGVYQVINDRLALDEQK